MATADGLPRNLFGTINLPPLYQFSAVQIDTMGWIHQNFSYVLMVFVCLHILGALKHHYIDQDPTLKRML